MAIHGKFVQYGVRDQKPRQRFKEAKGVLVSLWQLPQITSVTWCLHVHLKCFSAHGVILRAVTVCVCVDVAWLILMLQMIALSHSCLSLVETVGSPFSLLKASQHWCKCFLHWKKSQLLPPGVMFSMCVLRESFTVCCCGQLKYFPLNLPCTSEARSNQSDFQSYDNSDQS